MKYDFLLVRTAHIITNVLNIFQMMHLGYVAYFQCEVQSIKIKIKCKKKKKKWFNRRSKFL